MDNFLVKNHILYVTQQEPEFTCCLVFHIHLRNKKLSQKITKYLIWKYVWKDVTNISGSSECAVCKFWEMTVTSIKKPEQCMYSFYCFIRTGNNCASNATWEWM